MGQSWQQSLGRLRSSFIAETGEHPTAFIMHYDDWDDLLRGIIYLTRYPGTTPMPTKFMGMVPLLSATWPKGFPSCLDQEASAGALSHGARAA